MKHMCTRLPLASQIKINAHLAFWRPTKIIEKQSFMGGERQKKKMENPLLNWQLSDGWIGIGPTNIRHFFFMPRLN